jgi:alkanesulfonate monooxygenase SsuD/methylene tetrahydromethanopterin reductase-like flavin-dependent oxidoreductase (luciferase family)
MIEHRKLMRDQVEREQGVKLSPHLAPGPLGFLCGSPATVAAELAELAAIGIGGALMQFRLGAMPYETAAASIELFMREVAPQFRAKREAAE